VDTGSPATQKGGDHIAATAWPAGAFFMASIGCLWDYFKQLCHCSARRHGPTPGVRFQMSGRAGKVAMSPAHSSERRCRPIASPRYWIARASRMPSLSTNSENVILYRLLIQINLTIIATGYFAKSLAQGGRGCLRARSAHLPIQ